MSIQASVLSPVKPRITQTLVKLGLVGGGLFGRFGDAEQDWWAGLPAVQVPLLAVAGGGDLQDPEWACRKLFDQFGSPQRTFLSLGRVHGFSEDYGHIEMLVSKAAQNEVWPLLGRWLENGWLPEQGAEDRSQALA